MSQREIKSSQIDYNNLEDRIREEIKLAKEKKISDLKKIEDEILHLRLTMEEHKSSMTDEIETFYNCRLKSLQSVLSGCGSDETDCEMDAQIQFDSIKKKHRKRLIDEVSKFLKGETIRSTEFYALKSAQKLSLDSIERPSSLQYCNSLHENRKKYHISQKITELTSKEVLVYSSVNSIIGIIATKDKPRREIWDLENHIKLQDVKKTSELAIRLEDNEILNNVIPSQMGNEGSKLIGSENQVFFKGNVLDFKRKNCICVGQKIFWAEKNDKRKANPPYQNAKERNRTYQLLEVNIIKIKGRTCFFLIKPIFFRSWMH